MLTLICSLVVFHFSKQHSIICITAALLHWSEQRLFKRSSSRYASVTSSFSNLYCQCSIVPHLHRFNQSLWDTRSKFIYWLNTLAATLMNVVHACVQLLETDGGVRWSCNEDERLVCDDGMFIQRCRRALLLFWPHHWSCTSQIFIHAHSQTRHVVVFHHKRQRCLVSLMCLDAPSLKIWRRIEKYVR